MPLVSLGARHMQRPIGLPASRKDGKYGVIPGVVRTDRLAIVLQSILFICEDQLSQEEKRREV